MNQRQIEIILEMWKKKGEFLTASYFAEKFGKSLRTIQSDIKNISKSLDDSCGARIRSVASKGSSLEIIDEQRFSSFINSLYQEYAEVSLNFPASRINKLLVNLLSQFRAVSSASLEDSLHISHSMLLGDLKKVEEILGYFDLELMRSGSSLIITGSEIDKRRCLAEKNIYMRHIRDDHNIEYLDENQLSIIKDLLMNVLLENRFYIADSEIQNAILFLNITLKRLERSFYIQPGELEITDDLSREMTLSRQLFEQMALKFRIHPTEEEISYFALYLKGQSNNQNKAIITPEMDAFIQSAFDKIRQNFGIDFTDNINLRIALALHCTPLSIRIKYKMQLRNNLLSYIKQMFPLGYDLAIFFSLMLEERYGSRLSDAEVSLLAVHFYSSLLETNSRKGTKKILVITSLKNSMTMLLRQTLLKWFGQNISRLDFRNAMAVGEGDLDEYDVFLTTEPGEFVDNGIAMLINTFPDDHDYLNLKLLLDGFKNIDDILGIFPEDLFVYRDAATKSDVIRTLSRKAEEKYGIDTLYGEVLKREDMRSSYFSKKIAMPHPMHAVSSDTFAAVCITDKPVVWDDQGNEVNLIVMLGIGRNNPQAFQLWDYFAKIFADENFAERASEQDSYEHFIAALREALRTGIAEFE